MGRDVWTIPFEDVSIFIMYFFIIEVFYCIIVACMKLALLFFFLRIFQFGKARILLRITIIFSSLFGVVFAVVAVFQCSPVDYFWNKVNDGHVGHCINVNALGWSQASVSIALDFWMLFLPLWQLRKLNLDWRRKLGVGIMFFVGTL